MRAVTASEEREFPVIGEGRAPPSFFRSFGTHCYKAVWIDEKISFPLKTRDLLHFFLMGLRIIETPS